MVTPDISKHNRLFIQIFIDFIVEKKFLWEHHDLESLEFKNKLITMHDSGFISEVLHNLAILLLFD